VFVFKGHEFARFPFLTLHRAFPFSPSGGRRGMSKGEGPFWQKREKKKSFPWRRDKNQIRGKLCEENSVLRRERGVVFVVGKQEESSQAHRRRERAVL
jgi:hypothetical protein